MVASLCAIVPRVPLTAVWVPAACQGGSARPCSGNGRCSGDGSREGDGSCQCHPGYHGALCTDCVDGYFSSLRNETHAVCTGNAQRPSVGRQGRPSPELLQRGTGGGGGGTCGSPTPDVQDM